MKEFWSVAWNVLKVFFFFNMRLGFYYVVSKI